MITTKGFDVTSLSYSSASLEKNNYFKLILDNQELFHVPHLIWEQSCVFLLSHVHSEWIDYFNQISLLPKNLSYRIFDTTAKLQVFISLVHLVYQIKVKSLDKILRHGENIDVKNIYYGKVFLDNLPPRNKLIVLPSDLQNELKGDLSVTAEIMRIGQLYECSFLKQNPSEYDNGSKFYYRPYNTPVKLDRLSDKAQAMFQQIRKFYDSILRK